MSPDSPSTTPPSLKNVCLVNKEVCNIFCDLFIQLKSFPVNLISHHAASNPAIHFLEKYQIHQFYFAYYLFICYCRLNIVLVFNGI